MINKKMILNSKYDFLKPYVVEKLIRLGRKFDGGYLVCDTALKEIDSLITLGVGDDISFEIDMEKKIPLKKIQMYDYTVNHSLFLKIIIKYIRRLITFRTKLENLTFSFKNYVNFIKFNKKSKVNLFKKRVVEKLEKKFDITLDEILNHIDSEKNLLKLDIEGGEYSLIKSINQNHLKIKILIIEFHFIKEKKNLFIESVKKLMDNFDIVHIHANNYFELKENDDFFEVCEITFVNKQINKFREKLRHDFPLKDLDFECFPDRKKIKFSFRERT